MCVCACARVCMTGGVPHLSSRQQTSLFGEGYSFRVWIFATNQEYLASLSDLLYQREEVDCVTQTTHTHKLNLTSASAPSEVPTNLVAVILPGHKHTSCCYSAHSSFFSFSFFNPCSSLISVCLSQLLPPSHASSWEFLSIQRYSDITFISFLIYQTTTTTKIQSVDGSTKSFNVFTEIKDFQHWIIKLWTSLLSTTGLLKYCYLVYKLS